MRSPGQKSISALLHSFFIRVCKGQCGKVIDELISFAKIRPMGPWARGPMGPWAHGPMGPWAHGPMGPWVSVALLPASVGPPCEPLVKIEYPAFCVFSPPPPSPDPCVRSAFSWLPFGLLAHPLLSLVAWGSKWTLPFRNF